MPRSACIAVLTLKTTCLHLKSKIRGPTAEPIHHLCGCGTMNLDWFSIFPEFLNDSLCHREQISLFLLHLCPTSCSTTCRSSPTPHLKSTPLPPAHPTSLSSPVLWPTGLPSFHSHILQCLLTFHLPSWTTTLSGAHLFLLHRVGWKDAQVVPAPPFPVPGKHSRWSSVFYIAQILSGSR